MYETLYRLMVRAGTEALEQLDRQNIGVARDTLRRALEDTEKLRVYLDNKKTAGPD